jgi:CubicO group peptidase (beta-lactamase class C family)
MRFSLPRTMLGALTLALSLTANVHAQAARDPLTAHVDSVFSRYTAGTPGCAVGVYRNGAIAFAKGYGLANLEYDVPITPTTPFIVGSVSKQFTAAAIALLVEDKRISLDDDVRKYVPELPDYGTRITIDHLVHHTSGLRDWWELVGVAGLRYDDTYTVQDVLDMTARQRGLNFKPGDRYLYSNTGYILLGVIVQRVSGKSLREFAAERIFSPLQMTSSHFQDDHRETVRGRAYAYSPASNGRYPINVWNNDLVGQGGVMTTITDLLKWDENFYTGVVGGQAFLARQLQRGKLNSDSLLTYAFGLEVINYRGLPVVEHTGSTGGYRAVITRFPRQHTSVAVLCNVSNAAPSTLARRVADYVLSSELAPAAPSRAASGNTSAAPAASRASAAVANASRFAGTYYSDELDATYRLTASGSALVLERPRARADTLVARDSLTMSGSVGTLRFKVGRDNTAESFLLDAGRVEKVLFTRRAANR